MNKCLLLFFLLMNAVVYAQLSAKKYNRNTQTIHLVFKNTAGDSLLQTGSFYTNVSGEIFSVRAFKYYISNVQLQFAGETKFKKINLLPRLINETDSSSKNIIFNAPVGKITSIRFLIGADSLANISGVQTGDLDPAKGMYWVWNTGYIMAKLEGTSPASKAPGKQFSYDIGGYKKDEKAARTITLNIPPTINHQLSTFIVKADVLKWFTGAHAIKISEHPMCHEPGNLAMQIADNYERMFSIAAQ